VRRVCIFGASGSGKTTLGLWLAEQRNLRFVDLDDLHWLPGWVERASEEFRADVDRVTRAARRAAGDWWSDAPVCNGNRQRRVTIVTGRDSLLGHTLRTYHKRRREWPAALARPEHARATLVRLRSDADVARWRREVQAGNTPVER
jgi:hypothetical protein